MDTASPSTPAATAPATTVHVPTGRTVEIVDESALTLAMRGGSSTWQLAAPLKFTRLAGHSAILAGGRLGLLRRDKHVVSVQALRRVDRTRGPRALDFQSAGVLLGWETNGLALLQNYGHLLVGAGRARYAQRNTSPLFVLEPELGITWKLARSVRIPVGISWRGVWGNTSRAGLEPRALDGWSASVGLIVGTYPSLEPSPPKPTKQGNVPDRTVVLEVADASAGRSEP